jgi:UDP-N-acetylglucosamine--N-acetylmuramyl-(pentapeptide) pyrophosphoryl-undecaprenol N-acetylglucosamine transferase
MWTSAVTAAKPRLIVSGAGAEAEPEMSVSILIMAGGTGGHVMPALAVAEWLRERDVDVRWLGTRRGIEARLVPQHGFPIYYITISGLRGHGVLDWVLAPFKITFACAQAMVVLLRQRPSAVLGMGGFVTGPGGLTAWLLRRPLVIHEQNAIAGLSNRWLSHFATRVLEAFPNTFASDVKASCTGNPVRAAIAAAAPPEQRLASEHDNLRVLVIGGSQGAAALNATVPEAIGRLADAAHCEIWHQCGQREFEVTKARYAGISIESRVDEFITDMAAAYSWADLIICRAGALTVAEVAAVGVASILVPYPFAVDDHQSANARYLVDAGAALLVHQDTLSAEGLAEMLTQFMSRDGRERLVTMAKAARALARDEATAMVGSACLEVAHA